MNQKAASHTALLWIVAVGFFMQSLDTTIVNTALPAMAHQLGASPLEMQAVIVGYTLTMALLTPASGWLADRFGTRTVYFTSILIFVIGSLACASVHSVNQLVIARVIQGVGGSMLMPIGRLAVLRRVSGEQYVAALAMISVAGQVGPLLGPTLGGWFAEALSWHWVFLINLPIGVAGMLAVRHFLQDDALPTVEPFDFIGCGLLSLCMVSFSLGVDTPVATHRGVWALGLIALSVASALAYIPYAKARAHPIFNLSLFREPNFSVGLIGNLVCRVGSSSVPFLLPLLFQLQLGYTPFHSGLMMLPTAIAGILAKRCIAPLIKRYGYSTFLLVNTLIVGGSIVAFAIITNSTPLVISVFILAVFGASNSMQFAAMNSVTLKSLPASEAGSGNSLFSMVQTLAIGLGVSTSSSLVRIFSGALDSTSDGFRVSFAIVGTITLLSALVFRRVVEHPRSATPSPRSSAV